MAKASVVKNEDSTVRKDSTASKESRMNSRDQFDLCLERDFLTGTVCDPTGKYSMIKGRLSTRIQAISPIRDVNFYRSKRISLKSQKQEQRERLSAQMRDLS